MKEITQSEAQEALNSLNDETTRFSISGKPDKLGNIYVYPVRIWSGEEVDWKDFMFIREQGRVKRYESSN